MPAEHETRVAKVVTIIADPGASLDRNGDGPVLEVRSDGADVKIYDLAITGATGVSTAYGIELDGNGGTPKLELTRVKVHGNQGVGVYSAGGALTVSRSTFASNAGGGIQVMGGTFKIIGNLFFANGSATSFVGGVTVQAGQSSVNRLEFNSFNKNQTVDGEGSAIDCSAGTFTARNNIMSGNGTLSNMEQVSGTCSHVYSIATPGTLPAGAGNIAMDPMFVNASTGDLHIMPGSPAIGAADPSSDLGDIAAQDLDGDPRSSPADIGADEVP